MDSDENTDELQNINPQDDNELEGDNALVDNALEVDNELEGDNDAKGDTSELDEIQLSDLLKKVLCYYTLYIFFFYY